MRDAQGWAEFNQYPALCLASCSLLLSREKQMGSPWVSSAHRQGRLWVVSIKDQNFVTYGGTATLL